MAKRKTRAKRSLGALPKGLPQRRKHGLSAAADVNPFEVSSRQKRAKHEVHNRRNNNAQQQQQQQQHTNPQSALAKSLQRRQTQLKESLVTSKKANAFVDRRIGEYNTGITADEQMLARLVRERSRRSKRASKYSLEEDNDEVVELTHKGRTIDDLTAKDHVMLSDNEEDGNLDALDTELHFGGGSFGRPSAYGPGADDTNMSQLYLHKKMELDDLIARRKVLKAERVRSKEEQANAFENMDDSFKEIASMLQFRDKEKEYKQREEARKSGYLTQEDEEMADWDKEMKEYLFERKVKATDRTKTPEEIAKEEAERLHELETRRLARMNGDFDQDDFSDISDDEGKRKRKKSKTSTTNKSKKRNPDELDNSDDEEKDKGMDVRFTLDGLVYVDKDGNPVKKVGNKDESGNSDSDASSLEHGSSESEDENAEAYHQDSNVILAVGTRVQGNYRVKEQYGKQAAWYDGVITKVIKQADGSATYDVTYDDGDFEDDMEPENVRPVEKTSEEKVEEVTHQEGEVAIRRKRQKAKEKARQDIPFVFEVPTTLEALHDMIGNYASTGQDASLIIQRIHKANSVRLNRKNMEKMQNFYDVLLRRFVAVGDAIHSSGDGGPTLGRYKQLDELTKTLYAMSQDSPECAGAVWGRRLGILQNAHAKRLRDAEFAINGDHFSAWPSTGTILLLRALGHVFPVTDMRHYVVTPALLLIGQMVAQTPVRSMNDAVIGIMCAGLMIDCTKDANRIAPEALSFLAGVLRLFVVKPGRFPIPSLEAAAELPAFASLRKRVSVMSEIEEIPRLSLHTDDIEVDKAPFAVLCSALHLIEAEAVALCGSLNDAEAETFAEITESLLALQSKKYPLPELVAQKVFQVASALSSNKARVPLLRRMGPSVTESAIKTLAPRMEDPTRYSLSKDKRKTSVQAAIDRTRREYKREHKAVARELRLDAAFIESERRKEKGEKDAKAREKRNKNFSWMEGEQAAMNQQVRQGGGLLSGGGMGAARAKASSGKVGIKKGGKFKS